MIELIKELYACLNLLKDFGAGYSSNTCGNGLMMIIYKGKNYAVKIVEMDEQEDLFDAINCTQYYFKITERK